ncbi:MAG: beta-glucosidase [Pseudomonadota bacterium]
MNIAEILDQMTLEEQASILSGADFWTTVPVERLGIPKIKVTDGPNGARGGGSLVGGVKSACFPAAIAVGSSWNPELARELGKALAEEAKTKSARVLLAPTVNIHRSGLNGRNFECYSEDPYLTSELAVAYIEGVQGEGIAATIKHYVGNESEIERATISSDIDERTLREIYFPPFEAAVKRANVRAVMSSYNRLNGTYTSDHPWLLTEVLRGDWGFDGIVMSDWFGSHSTVESVNAGLDLEMPGPTRDRGAKLVAAVKDGLVKAETVRKAAGNMLRLLEWVGAFEDATMHEEQAIDRPEHRALIRRMGAEGTVLLRNDGVLPLARAEIGAIAVIGPNADTARVMGGGSAQINAHYRVSPLEGIRTALAGKNAVLHARGADNSRLMPMLQGPVTVEFFDSVDLSGPVVHRMTLAEAHAFWLDPISPKLDMSAFSARISGEYTASEDGTHVFGAVTAGRGLLKIDGEVVADFWDDWTQGTNFFSTGNDEQRASVSMKLGQTVRYELEYRTGLPGDALMALRAFRIGAARPLGDADIAEAVERARDADVAVIFAGREGEWDTEGQDLPHFNLPGKQDALIEAVLAVNPRTIVVLQTGGPVLMPWFDRAAAVMQCWYPGQEAGNAIADVLFGDAEPGGRLPQTFPRRAIDNSAFTDDILTYPGLDGHVAYREGIFVGYRHHDTRGIKPFLPFGFGLSYTIFVWANARLSAPVMEEGGLSVSVEVTNTGARSGSDVVQLYIRPLDARAERPEKELKAFAKLSLDAGQTGTAVLSISHRDLSRFDVERKAWIADAGRYEAVIAANAEDIRFVLPFTLEAEWQESLR